MEQRNVNSVRSSAFLTLAAFIWGVAFAAQSEGMNYVGGFTFTGCRYLLGGIVLVPVILVAGKARHVESANIGEGERQAYVKNSMKGGVCCGLCLFVASSLQQFGIASTTVGKAGFITALYIVLVPVLGLFLHRKVNLGLWFSVALATAGMYFLCITDGFAVGKGDFLVFLSAVAFTFHILMIDFFSPRGDGVVISCIQFFTVGLLGCAAMFLVEQPRLDRILAAWLPIGYAGVLSSGVGYTLQVVAQKDMAPAAASLIMSLESVFSLLAGWVLLHQRLSGRELLGCAMVFAAILLVQLPVGKTIGLSK